MLRNLARYAMPLCIERCISRWSAGVSWWPSCSSLAMVSNSISRGVMIILAGCDVRSLYRQFDGLLPYMPGYPVH